MRRVLSVGASLVTSIVKKTTMGERIVLVEDLTILTGVSCNLNGHYSMIVIDGIRNGAGDLRVKLEKGAIFEIDQDFRDVIISNQFTTFRGTRKIRAREVTDNEEAAYIWFRFEGKGVGSFAEGFLATPSSNKVLEIFSAQVTRLS